MNNNQNTHSASKHEAEDDGSDMCDKHMTWPETKE